MSPTRLLRQRTGSASVTNIELFFDLVYVFAVTQLSHYLLDHQTAAGAGQAALLLAMVWLLWAYTAWVTNFLDPERLPVRVMLFALMAASLVLSAAIPGAFGARGLAVGSAYAAMQIGRTIFALAAVRGSPLQRNFQRILVWCVVSSALAVAGGLAHGHARELLWLGAVAVDLGGGAVGFYTPGLGRSRTGEWTIEGGHFAERCQGFVLIALGESIVVIGTTFSRLASIDAAEVTAFAVACVGAFALWWIYFDRSAGDAAELIAASADPGRLGRSAYHFIHPIMIAGVIVVAAADQLVLSRPGAVGHGATTWMVLGGTALFLVGHAAFKAVVWRMVPWSRLTALAVLALLVPAAAHVAALALAALAGMVVIGVATADRIVYGGPQGHADGQLPRGPATGRRGHHAGENEMSGVARAVPRPLDVGWRSIGIMDTEREDRHARPAGHVVAGRPTGHRRRLAPPRLAVRRTAVGPAR